MKRRDIVIPFILIAILLSAGCASPYVTAQKQYWSGDPATAEQTLTPKAEEAIEKDNKEKNLMAWDLGIYRFSQENYDGAIEVFMEGVRDVEELHSTGQTVAAALTNASSQKYIGDPVEVSMAYLYIGLSYYMKGDYQNALIGFRRSLEEDLSKDEARQGDMGITNYMMGETFLQIDRYDDAAVAFRRAIEHQDDLAPAYMGLYGALAKMGSTTDLMMIENKLDSLVDGNIKENWREYPDQGITVAMFCGRASKIEKDAFLGAFRKRAENKHKVKQWYLNVIPEPGRSKIYFSDAMHEHFTDQGGLGDEIRKQTTRAVVGAGMKALLGFSLGGADADIRYWPTIPGYIYIGYVPVPAGSYSIEVEGLSNKDKPIEAFTRTHSGIGVAEGKRTLVVLTSFGTVSSSVNR
jgi:tetratricopeptide (TPR) repeat protein